MPYQIEIAPSILSANWRNLDADLKQLETANINYLHFDVMDGHFVPNISFGLPILQSLKGHYPFIMDVHIMIADPETYAAQFVAAGAHIVTFHIEAVADIKHALRVIKLIKDAGGKAGISLKPATSVTAIVPLLPELDLVLVMSVEPGFGGQKFIRGSLDKIKQLRKLKDENNYSYLIEVDGGINDETAKLVSAAGAEVLVAGSYIFGHDIARQIATLRQNNG